MEFLRKTVIPEEGILIIKSKITRRINVVNFKLGQIKFILNVLPSGEFELKESGEIVASGQISAPSTIDKELLNLVSPKTKKDEFLPLESTEIYKELRLKGYDYKDPFRGIKSINNIGKYIFVIIYVCILHDKLK